MGKVNYERKESEKGSAKFRRSLYITKDVAEGEILTHENVKSIRPGYGLAPKYLTKIIGKKDVQLLKSGTPVSKSIYSN